MCLLATFAYGVTALLLLLISTEIEELTYSFSLYLFLLALALGPTAQKPTLSSLRGLILLVLVASRFK